MRLAPWTLVAALAVLCPALASPQGLGVEHDPVGCVVARHQCQGTMRVEDRTATTLTVS